MIERVTDIKTANECDELLTLLVRDERKFETNNSDDNFIVKDYFKNFIIKNNHYLFCYKTDDKTVAFIYLKPTLYDGRDGYIIDGLYVLEEYRRNKIATNLIKQGLNEVKEKCDFVEISVMSGNEYAEKLYKSFGFKDFKTTLRIEE